MYLISHRCSRCVRTFCTDIHAELEHTTVCSERGHILNTEERIWEIKVRIWCQAKTHSLRYLHHLAPTRPIFLHTFLCGAKHTQTLVLPCVCWHFRWLQSSGTTRPTNSMCSFCIVCGHASNREKNCTSRHTHIPNSGTGSKTAKKICFCVTKSL